MCIRDSKNIFEKKTDPHVFNIINIGSKQDVNKIVIIVDDVIQRIYDVSTDEKKQIIKDNCYILKIN